MVAMFLQWNCRSIKLKKNDLIFLINKFKPVVFAVQEMWLSPGSHFRVTGFSCFRDDRDDGYAGSTLLVSRSISYSQIPLPSHSVNINMVAVRAINITFVSVYFPSPNLSVLSEFRSLITGLPLPLVILGDFNIHHTSWGCLDCDAISPSFLEIVDDFNLCFLNDGTATRRATPSQNQSAVDLTLCSSVPHSLLSWSVLTSTYGSDHFPLLISLPNYSDDDPPQFNPRQKFNVRKADWSRFSVLSDAASASFPPVNVDNVHNIYILASKMQFFLRLKVLSLARDHLKGVCVLCLGGIRSVLTPVKGERLPKFYTLFQCLWKIS